MKLPLNNEEQEFLLTLLEQHHRQLLNEIAHTDRREFKHALRRNEEFLDSLLSRLRASTPEPVHG